MSWILSLNYIKSSWSSTFIELKTWSLGLIILGENENQDSLVSDLYSKRIHIHKGST